MRMWGCYCVYYLKETAIFIKIIDVMFLPFIRQTIVLFAQKYTKI